MFGATVDDSKKCQRSNLHALIVELWSASAMDSEASVFVDASFARHSKVNTRASRAVVLYR